MARGADGLTSLASATQPGPGHRGRVLGGGLVGIVIVVENGAVGWNDDGLQGLWLWAAEERKGRGWRWFVRPWQLYRRLQRPLRCHHGVMAHSYREFLMYMHVCR